MSLSAIVNALISSGCTPEQIGAAVSAHEAESMRAIEARRANDRERKARQRHVKSRELTGHSGTCCDKKGSNSSPEVPPKEYISNPLPPPSFPPKNEKPNTSCLSKKPASQRTSISETEQPTQSDLGFAATHGFDKQKMREEWAQFRDHHRKLGNRMADWRAAWRTWVRNTERFGSRAPPIPPENNRNVYLDRKNADALLHRIIVEKYGESDDEQSGIDSCNGQKLLSLIPAGAPVARGGSGNVGSICRMPEKS